jgi:hypothetical protein
VLEDANIKLSSLITEVLGASGRRILKALIADLCLPKRSRRRAEACAGGL